MIQHASLYGLAGLVCCLLTADVRAQFGVATGAYPGYGYGPYATQQYYDRNGLVPAANAGLNINRGALPSSQVDAVNPFYNRDYALWGYGAQADEYSGLSNPATSRYNRFYGYSAPRSSYYFFGPYSPSALREMTPDARQAVFAANTPVPTARPTTVKLRVLLPTQDAAVWIENQPTRRRGLVREYISPPLQPRQEYKYHVKAAWTTDGVQKEVTRVVPVEPGQQVVVDFNQPRQKTTPAARPADVVQPPPPLPADETTPAADDDDRNAQPAAPAIPPTAPPADR